jgi:hypothetical protein
MAGMIPEAARRRSHQKAASAKAVAAATAHARPASFQVA